MGRYFKATIDVMLALAGPQVSDPGLEMDPGVQKVKISAIRATRTATGGVAYPNFDVEVYDASARAAKDKKYENLALAPDAAGIILIEARAAPIVYRDASGLAQIHARIRANGGDATSTATVRLDIEGEILE